MSRIALTVLRNIVPKSPIFTTAHVVAATGATTDTASRALSRLETTGLIAHLVRGLWADTRHPNFSPYAVVPFLVQRSVRGGGKTVQGYVSFLSALHLHEMLSQIPAAIHVAVVAPRRRIHTPVGVYEFHRLQPELLDGHRPGDAYGRFELATPTKALFDTIYVSARRGRRFSRLPELELPRSVTDAEMQRWIARIAYVPLRTAVAERWAVLRARREARSTR